MKALRVLALVVLAVGLVVLPVYCQKAGDSGANELAQTEPGHARTNQTRTSQAEPTQTASHQARSPLTFGERFHAETCLTSSGALADQSAAKPAMPDRFKSYAGARVIELPKADYRGLRLEEAMSKRHSVRQYKPEPITLSQLSQLLFSAQGITGSREEYATRTAPSAGALYPFELYVVATRVKDLPQGLYHYAVREHGLELVREGNLGENIMQAGFSQESLGDAAVVIVLTAIFDRARSKYGERGFRYVYMEAGHIAQNLCLEVVSLGLGSVTVGAFLDDEVNRLIGIDGVKEAAIYLHPVGAI